MGIDIEALRAEFPAAQAAGSATVVFDDPQICRDQPALGAAFEAGVDVRLRTCDRQDP